MSFVGRLFRLAFAFIAAIFTGTIAIFIVWPFAPDTMMVAIQRLFDIIAFSERPDLVISETATSIGHLLTMLLVAPVVVIGLIGEVARWKSSLWYIAGTGILTAAVPWLLRPETRVPSPGELYISALLALVGAIIGLVYWLIAGKSTRRTDRDAPTTPRTPVP